MKKYLLFVSMLLSLTGNVPAAAGVKSGDIGAGIIIGAPLGISGKYWLSDRQAVDGAFTITGKNELYLHLDYLLHDYRAFPVPNEGELPLYYGGGMALSSRDGFGVRGIIGINYLFEGFPFDLFLEIGPVLYFAPDLKMNLNGGVGGRYYFH